MDASEQQSRLCEALADRLKQNAVCENKTVIANNLSLKQNATLRVFSCNCPNRVVCADIHFALAFAFPTFVLGSFLCVQP